MQLVQSSHNLKTMQLASLHVIQLRQFYKRQTPLTPQDVLSTHRNNTRTIKTYRCDHWSTKIHINDL